VTCLILLNFRGEVLISGIFRMFSSGNKPHLLNENTHCALSRMFLTVSRKFGLLAQHNTF